MDDTMKKKRRQQSNVWSGSGNPPKRTGIPTSPQRSLRQISKQREDALNIAIQPIQQEEESGQRGLVNSTQHEGQDGDISKDGTTPSSAGGGDAKQQVESDGEINHQSNANECSDADNEKISDGSNNGERMSDQQEHTNSDRANTDGNDDEGAKRAKRKEDNVTKPSAMGPKKDNVRTDLVDIDENDENEANLTKGKEENIIKPTINEPTKEDYGADLVDTDDDNNVEEEQAKVTQREEENVTEPNAMMDTAYNATNENKSDGSTPEGNETTQQEHRQGPGGNETSQKCTSATMSSLAPSGISPVQEFEPVLNAQAAASFVIIAVVFTLLQLRINAVSNAAKRQSSALEALRKVELLQLSASDVDEKQVAQAKFEYKNALKEELGLRTIVPGVRIVAPNDPKRDEEERANAKRFLGWGRKEFGDDDTERDIDINNNNSLDLDGNKKMNLKDESRNDDLSEISKVILFRVASMLIVLLWTLSFDPMLADQVFTTIGGSPPSDMPLTSW